MSSHLFSATNLTTSKTKLIIDLIRRAWRERWSDIQWGINIKKIFPRGVSGDVYHLADYILQQLVGSDTSHLIFSYLKHSLSSHLISYPAVLHAISKFDALHRTQCILNLLEFLKNIHICVTSRNIAEETQLPSAILSIINWLLDVYQYVLSKADTSAWMFSDKLILLEKTAKIINNTMQCEFIKAMCCVAKQTHLELYSDIMKKCYEIPLLKINNVQPSNYIDQTLQDLIDLDVDNYKTSNPDQIIYCMQVLLITEVTHNPNSTVNVILSQMLLIKRIKGFTMSRLYYEIIRACWLSFYHGNGPKENRWIALMFIKIPKVLLKLHELTKKFDDRNDYSQDLIDGIELFLQHTPLLDSLDIKCSCNCLEIFLNELLKLSLVTDEQVKEFVNKRVKVVKKQNGELKKAVQQAKPILSIILMSLNKEKIEEHILGNMLQFIPKEKFELISTVALIDNKLKTLVNSLIKLNERTKQSSEILDIISFDASFLILYSFVHMFGLDIFEQNKESFFVNWAHKCMFVNCHPKSPKKIMELCDQTIVDELLIQFNSNEFTGEIKWDEICLNIPGVIQEILIAWETATLSDDDVKRMLNTMMKKMCCFSIVATSWLCSYMKIVQQECLSKPLNMIRILISQINNQENQIFKERWNLMYILTRKMLYDINLPIKNTINGSVSKLSIYQRFHQLWYTIQEKGFIDYNNANALKCILENGGPNWFVSNIINETMKYNTENNLDKSVDTALGIFHLDIEKCTQTLLLNVLPQYLCNSEKAKELIEPQSLALAKLCAYVIFAAFEYSIYNPTISKKRNRSDDETTNDKYMSGTYQINRALKEPLLSILHNLFRMITNVLICDEFKSQKIYFIISFIKFIVSCGDERSSVILQTLPGSLISSLIRAVPELFTYELILKLHNINTARSRFNIVKDLCLLRNFELRKPCS